MRVETQAINVTLSRGEAEQVLNALLVGLKDTEFSHDQAEHYAAHQFKELLLGNFRSQVTGIHKPESK